jgi:hypothetical protein
MITPKDIDKIISQVTGISIEQIHSASQKQTVCDARNLAMLKCKEQLRLSTIKLRKLYEKDSHTTILSDLKSAKNLIETNPLASERAAKVEKLIQERKELLLVRKQHYNLCYRIRQKGLILDRKRKILSIHPDRQEELKKVPFVKLIKIYGYSVQYSIV